MTRQLATMVSSGMTILKALYVLEGQTESKPLARDAHDASARTSRPACRSRDALERNPKVFNPLYVAMVRAGETGGVLETALMRTAEQLEADDSLRRQVKSAMVYPGVIMTFAGVVLIALVVFLVPVFEGVFEQFGGELPPITKFTVNALGRDDRAAGTCSSSSASASSSASSSWKGSAEGPQAVGHAAPQVPLQDRRHRPEGLAGPLVAHALGAHHRRRPAHAGARDHRQDRRATGRSRRRWTRSSRRSAAAARSPPRSRSRRSSRAWSRT